MEQGNHQMLKWIKSLFIKIKSKCFYHEYEVYNQWTIWKDRHILLKCNKCDIFRCTIIKE